MQVDHWRSALVRKDGATIEDAIASLNSSALQIVLVVGAEDTLIGTITDGDIRRGLLRGLTLKTDLDEIVHRDPFVVPQGLAPDAVLAIMSANAIRQLPIVDSDQRVQGLHLWNELPGSAASAPARSNTMVIMAGGKGTRLRPYTEQCPKPMLPVAGKPMLEHIIERAKADGIERFLLSVNYLAHMIEDHFGDGSRLGLKIEYIHEDKPLGTGGALSLLDEQFDAPLLVTNGDVITDVSYREMLDFHTLHGATATMAIRRHEMRNQFGVVLTNGIDLTGFEEKPVITSHINAGIYVLDPSALDVLNPGEHCDMPTLFERLRTDKRRTIVFPLHEKWLDVGHPVDLEKARKESDDDASSTVDPESEPSSAL